MRKIDLDGVERIDVRIPTACINDTSPAGVARVFGAINYWDARPENAHGTPPSGPPTVDPPVAEPTNPPEIGVSTLPWFDAIPGRVYVTKALVAGRIAAAVSDGDAPGFATLDPKISPDYWEWGKGGAPGMSIAADQNFYFRYEGRPGLQMRVELMP